MAWLVDDVAEAALGPWGLLVGLGVGAVVLLRRRQGGAASSAIPVSVLAAAERARGRLATRRLPSPRLTAPRLPTPRIGAQARAALGGVTGAWDALYSEARAEWEAERAARAMGVSEATERLERATQVTEDGAETVRDRRGRFVKRAAE